MAVPPPLRAPSQRLLTPRNMQSRLSANDKGDNELKLGTVH